MYVLSLLELEVLVSVSGSPLFGIRRLIPLVLPLGGHRDFTRLVSGPVRLVQTKGLLAKKKKKEENSRLIEIEHQSDHQYCTFNDVKCFANDLNFDQIEVFCMGELLLNVENAV